MKHDDCPSPPALAVDVFGEERLPLVERFAALLATDGVVRGLIGPRETPRLWDRHLINCALLAHRLPDGASVADVGSGAGLPGLVLAIARPDLRLTLIEPLLRRTTFLQEVVDALALDHVTVHRGRADSLHGSAQFDVVTSRAVAPLGRLLEWSMPLVSPAGALVAMKGSSVADEVAEAAPILTRLGCGEPVVDVVSAPADPEASIHIVRVPWRDPGAVALRPSGVGLARSSQRSTGSRRGRSGNGGR